MLTRDVADGVHRVEDARVNWYLVEDGDALTVVDAGHPRSWTSLHAALRALGRGASAVRALVLTHGHFDHVGFAERARTELGVPVWVPEDEVAIARHPWRYPHERARTPYTLRHPGFVADLTAMAAAGALAVRGLRGGRTYRDGVRLDVPGRPLAVATPGHTPGHHALLLGDRGVLLAGDAVVTFDPYTQSEGPRIVAGAATADSARALASLDVLASTGARTVLTGHGPPWTGWAAEAARLARAAGPS
jgi:glyoxylase-like metal-dependent hydrolase (beta-lactamase superfamily II)